LSLSVRPGELVHLVGPNGAGKSTLVAIVAGLLRADTGSVEYFPQGDSAGPAEDRRLFLEYLPAEANGLFVKMDAVQNLSFWAQLRGAEASEERIFGALQRWHLDHPLLRQRFPVEKFSTGMKRRLALARLELSPAPCWLLDEPVYGLDAEATVAFTRLVAAHLAKGGLALVVSHETKPLEGLVTRSVTLGSA
jgi:heme exporter protein A